MEVPQKPKSKSTIWSTYTTLGSLSKALRVNLLQRYLHITVYFITIHNSEVRESTQVSMNRVSI